MVDETHTHKWEKWPGEVTVEGCGCGEVRSTLTADQMNRAARVAVDVLAVGSAPREWKWTTPGPGLGPHFPEADFPAELRRALVPCRTCGAAVVSGEADLHERWHNLLREQIDAAMRGGK